MKSIFFSGCVALVVDSKTIDFPVPCEPGKFINFICTIRTSTGQHWYAAHGADQLSHLVNAQRVDTSEVSRSDMDTRQDRLSTAFSLAPPSWLVSWCFSRRLPLALSTLNEHGDMEIHAMKRGCIKAESHADRE
jgi:hypothetical protein